MLGEFEPDHALHLLRYGQHCARPALEFRPRSFRGNLLRFVAADGRREIFSLELWEPYITGRIDVRKIPVPACPHDGTYTDLSNRSAAGTAPAEVEDLRKAVSQSTYRINTSSLENVMTILLKTNMVSISCS